MLIVCVKRLPVTNYLDAEVASFANIRIKIDKAFV